MTSVMLPVAGGRDSAAHKRRHRAARHSSGGLHLSSKPVALVLALVVALAGLLSGCATPRNGLSTHNSLCFRVYPEAMAAVHDRGRFAGERYLPPRALIIELHHVVVPNALKHASKEATCLVAFTGHFTDSNVERGWAPSGGKGRIAIVVVRQRDLVVLATVVLGRVPPRLVFAHVFPKLR